MDNRKHLQPVQMYSATRWAAGQWIIWRNTAGVMESVGSVDRILPEKRDTRRQQWKATVGNHVATGNTVKIALQNVVRKIRVATYGGAR